jgi:hypothetical protein
MLATSSYCHDKSTGMIVVIKWRKEKEIKKNNNNNNNNKIRTKPVKGIEDKHLINILSSYYYLWI